MKTKLRRLLTVATVFTIVSLTNIAVAQTGVGSAQTSGQARMARKGGRERHPAIRQAIGALQRAKTDMQHANHDFGGHRAEAMKACDDAIQQLKQALNYDKK